MEQQFKLSRTLTSPENWFQLCQCMAGYGISFAAGMGTTPLPADGASAKAVGVATTTIRISIFICIFQKGVLVFVIVGTERIM
jgi:hypothetical protein